MEGMRASVDAGMVPTFFASQKWRQAGAAVQAVLCGILQVQTDPTVLAQWQLQAERTVGLRVPGAACKPAGHAARSRRTQLNPWRMACLVFK